MAPSVLNATAAALPPPAELLLPPSLDNTLGAILVGTLVSFGIFGLNLHQAWQYHNSYSYSDTWAIKAVVFGLTLADTVHSVQCAHMCYYYLVQNYLHPLALLSGVWSLNLLPITSAVIITLAQSFYARRVYLTNKRHRYLVVLIVVLMLAELGFTILAGVETYIAVTFEKWLHYGWTETVALGIAMAVDLILTSTAVATLWGNRTGFKGTDNILTILIVWTVNTCLLTSALTVMTLLSSVLWPKNFIYIAVNLVATKTYASAVLAVLNSRESLATRITVSGGLQRSQRSVVADNWQMMPISPASAMFEIMSPDTATPFKSQDLLAEPRETHAF
ncbi:hypothetical protein LXA43DRAFT_1100917 [Ganoderma leucocontextum]|nr:hypothetical protein LXA43DRAFT_1100917 [Ganoderma leucocontextum]